MPATKLLSQYHPLCCSSHKQTDKEAICVPAQLLLCSWCRRWGAYGASKLANVLHAYELARRLQPQDNCTVNALHPGIIYSNLGRCSLHVAGVAESVCLQVCSQPAALAPHHVSVEHLFLHHRFLLPEHPPWWQQPLIAASKAFLKSPAQGAQTSIYLATSPEVEGTRRLSAGSDTCRAPSSWKHAPWVAESAEIQSSILGCRDQRKVLCG